MHICAGEWQVYYHTAPIEMRAFYGLGELFTQWAAGHMKYDNVGLEMANQILDLLPLNPIGAEGDIAGSIFLTLLNRLPRYGETKTSLVSRYTRRMTLMS